MVENTKLKPTEAELEILQILWKNGPSSVRHVNETLSIAKNVGYTTTLKIMQIMNDKGLTTRDTSSRTHVYQAAFTESSTKENMLQRFIKATFEGSAKSLVIQLLGSQNTTPSEIAEIKAFIKNLENKNEDELR